MIDALDTITKNSKLVIADDYEVVMQRFTENTRTYQNGELLEQFSDEGIWISLRILHRKRGGRSVTVSTHPDALSQLVSNAFLSAENTCVNPWFRLPILRNPPSKTKTNIGASGLASQFENLETCPMFEKAQLNETYQAWSEELQVLRKHERVSLKEKRQGESSYLELIVNGANQTKRFSDLKSQQFPIEQKSELAQDLISKAKSFEKPQWFNGEFGRGVVLGPEVVVGILRKMAPWFGADQIQKEQSPLSGVSPNNIMAPIINIFDDATLEGGAESCLFDMEGTLSEKTAVIENGNLKNALFDTLWATRENRRSTGNYRKLRSQPSVGIGPTNFYIEPGQESLETMLNQLGRGVYLECLDSLVPSSTHSTRMVMRAWGWQIESGEKFVPLRDIFLEVDVLELFQGALKLANDCRFLGNFGAPSILFRDQPFRNLR